MGGILSIKLWLMIIKQISTPLIINQLEIGTMDTQEIDNYSTSSDFFHRETHYSDIVSDILLKE
jgi:hypothetical protein